MPTDCTGGVNVGLLAKVVAYLCMKGVALGFDPVEWSLYWLLSAPCLDGENHRQAM